MDANSANVIGWHDKLLAAALAENKANPDFRFNLRVGDATGTNRLASGYWFTGTDKYLFFAPFRPHDQENKSRTIGFVIHFDKQGQPDHNSLEIVFGSTEDAQSRKFYGDLCNRIGNLQPIRDTKFKKPYRDTDPIKAFNDFLQNDYPRLRAIIHAAGRDAEFLIPEQDFQEMKSRIELYKVGKVSLRDTEATKQFRSNSAATEIHQNLILYGPPGTGKTYSAIERAVHVIDPACADDRTAIRHRYDELAKAGRIGFVTFHQSFSYEDFVEGIRAELNDKQQLSYPVVDGIFKKLCDSASARVTRQAQETIEVDNRRIWKMSLGNTLVGDDGIYEECLERGCVLLGYGDDINFTGCKSRDDIRRRFAEHGSDPKPESYAVTAVSLLALDMQKGDLIVVSDGNHKFRGIAEVTGDYRFLGDASRDGFWQCRDVRWLRAYKPSLPRDQLMNNAFSQMTLYELRPGSIDMKKLAGLLNSEGVDSAVGQQGSLGIAVGDTLGSGYRVLDVTADVLRLEKPNGSRLSFDRELLDELAGYVRDGRVTLDDIRQRRVFEKVDSRLEKYIVGGYESLLPVIVERMLAKPAQHSTEQRWVLIIDEINRGNVSRIFGELITLLEPDKRAGGAEALSVKLPYSKTDFSVPSNLHIVGTMNTADRSLTGLDIALRRRFEFEEIAPAPKLLDGIKVQDVLINELLESMNSRIEVLLNTDHCLGHSYFMPLKEDPSVERLAKIFKRHILPLLREYFFEDAERVRRVLNDHRKTDPAFCFFANPEQDLRKMLGDGDGLPTGNLPWRPNETALLRIESYRQIIRV